MSTSEKGSLFEARVYKTLQTELTNGNLLVIPSKSKIYYKKPYYSRDRESNIITDISIETSYNDDEVGLYIIIECKDCQKNISVDDIEEFESKLNQIVGKNIKGIFATTSALQKAALNYAISKKIAVFRFFPTRFTKISFNAVEPNEQEKISSEKDIERLQQDFNNALFDNEYSRNHFLQYGYYSNTQYTSIINFINFIENEQKTQ